MLSKYKDEIHDVLLLIGMIAIATGFFWLTLYALESISFPEKDEKEVARDYIAPVPMNIEYLVFSKMEH